MSCPEAFDKEVVGDHPRVYCRSGCGCWIYAHPAPGCTSCGTLCNNHPAWGCKTFICAIEGCRSHAELMKHLRGEPSELEKLPERTPEENKKLFEMLDELDREAGRKA